MQEELFLSHVVPQLRSVNFPCELDAQLFQKLTTLQFDAGEAFMLARIEGEEEEGEVEVDERAAKVPFSAPQKPYALVAVRDITASTGSAADTPSCCWLVDHCFTFKYKALPSQLDELDDETGVALAQRLADICGLNGVVIPEEDWEGFGKTKHGIYKILCDNLWSVAGSYQITTANSEKSGDEKQDATTPDAAETYWYVNDEVGSAVAVAETPQAANVGMAPLIVPTALFNAPSASASASASPSLFTLTVLWKLPGADVEEGDIARCAYGGSSSFFYRPLVEPSRPKGGESQQEEEEEEEAPLSIATLLYSQNEARRAAAFKLCYEKWDAFCRSREVRKPLQQQQLGDAAENEACAVGYPTWVARSTTDEEHATTMRSLPLKIYSDSALLCSSLTDSRNFQFVADPEAADIVFPFHYTIRNTREFPHANVISQFPQEGDFVNKARLAQRIFEFYGEFPAWLPETYDSTSELDLFVAAAAATSSSSAPISQACCCEGGGSSDAFGNYWIVKPQALARSMDMTISDSLPWMLRLAEASSPSSDVNSRRNARLYSRYLTRPCTFQKKKFDLRFNVLARSLSKPFDVYVCNMFWVRVANFDFGLSDFGNYERHWTVMNYAGGGGGAKLRTVLDRDFVPEFNKENAEHPAFHDWLKKKKEKKTKGEKEQQEEQQTPWDFAFESIKRVIGEALAPFQAQNDPRYKKKDNSNSEDISVEDLQKAEVRSRATYGVDFMLTEDLQPILLEINFSPDNTRAVKHSPELYNEIMRALVLGETSGTCSRIPEAKF